MAEYPMMANTCDWRLHTAPEAFHGAVAAGLLGCGSVVLGSAEIAGRFYAQLVDEAKDAARQTLPQRA